MNSKGCTKLENAELQMRWFNVRNNRKRKSPFSSDHIISSDLGITSTDDMDYCMRHIRYMESIVLQMLNDGLSELNENVRSATFDSSFLGHRFEKPETIMMNLQQGLWWEHISGTNEQNPLHPWHILVHRKRTLKRVPLFELVACRGNARIKMSPSSSVD